MYGVYATNDDEMFVMTQEQVFRYLSIRSAVFQNYGVHTDGTNVSVWETSAGANGKLSEISINEFLYGFEEEGWVIRKISNPTE